MICLGSIVFFRWEKYRLVSVYESFSAFHFCTIIAVIVSHRMWTIHDQTEQKRQSYHDPAFDAWIECCLLLNLSPAETDDSTQTRT